MYNVATFIYSVGMLPFQLPLRCRRAPKRLTGRRRMHNCARVAELVDAADLKYAFRNEVPVRVRPWAPRTRNSTRRQL